MQPSPSEHDPYNGLTRLEPSLPSSAYWDIEAYQRDLDAIWYRSWLLVCREADLAQPLAFRTFRVGTQEIVVLRDETGELRAFHNTCRHRGSQLCRGSEGRLKAAARHLPLPRLVLFAARRSRARAVEIAA
ncbi:Rieske 2Fe-2S domain-containing protein [Mesorhizobium sp. BHbdii]